MNGKNEPANTMAEPGTKIVIRVKMADLRPHPSQTKYFGVYPVARLRELAAQLRARGLDHPIEILPDFTIVCGHKRPGPPSF